MKIKTPYPTQRTRIGKLWYKHEDWLLPVIFISIPMLMVVGIMMLAFTFSN